MGLWELKSRQKDELDAKLKNKLDNLADGFVLMSKTHQNDGLNDVISPPRSPLTCPATSGGGSVMGVSVQRRSPHWLSRGPRV